MKPGLSGALFFACVGFSMGPSPALADRAYDSSIVTAFFAARIPACALNCPAPQEFDLSVFFDLDSAALSAAARGNLDQFAEALRGPRLSGQKFEIDGHADATGSDDYDLRLSQRRAEAVVAYLAAKGVALNRLRAKGFGKNRPLGADPFGAHNRRAEARLLGMTR